MTPHDSLIEAINDLAVPLNDVWRFLHDNTLHPADPSFQHSLQTLDMEFTKAQGLLTQILRDRAMIN